MNYKLISKNQYHRSTWKNGLGFTDQIAIYPENAVLSKGDFLWRLSTAKIEKSSPFSVFPNHDRVLVVLKGNGVRLTHVYEEGEAEEVVDVPSLEPYEFPGDITSRCELTQGAITDFSIFLRKAEVDPLIQVVELQADENFEWMPEGRWNFLFAISGDFQTPQGILHEGDTLFCEQKNLNENAHSLEVVSHAENARLLLVSLA